MMVPAQGVTMQTTSQLTRKIVTTMRNRIRRKRAGSFMSFAEDQFCFHGCYSLSGLNISSSLLVYEHDQIKNLHLQLFPS